MLRLRLRLGLAAFALVSSGSLFAFQQIPFDLPQLHEPTGQTNFRRAADLNGDGALDLVALNGHATVSTYNYEVWLGNGAGGFSRTFGTQLPGPHEGRYECAQLADLTGDGRLDLVLCAATLSPASVPVNVYAGQPNGNFAFPPLMIAHGGSLLALARGDGDGDGIQDIAVLRRDPNTASVRFVRWILSRPGIGYSAVPELQLPVGNETTLCAIDVDRDGDDDLACGVTGAFVLAESTAGGVLQHGATWNVATSFAAGVLSASSSDLDGDGDRDLLVLAARPDRAATIPLYVAGLAAPVQGAALERTMLTDYRPIAAESTDWDLDGDRDIVWRNNETPHPYGRILFYENAGTGSFVLAGELTARGDGHIVHLGDVDGDMRPDLVGPRELYRGRASFPGVPNGAAEVYFWKAVDVDDDGDLDRLGMNGDADLNDGSGAFALRENRFPPSIVPPPATRRFAGAMGDFDLDGREDFLVTYTRPSTTFPFVVFDSNALLFDDGAGSYREQHPVTNGFQLNFGSLGERTQVADLDGSGTGDYLSPVGVYFLQANGQFSTAAYLFSGMAPIAAADVDGDQDIDVVASQTFPYSQYFLFRNLGQAAFGVPEPLGFTVFLNTTIGALLDLDEDGDLDFATTSSAPENDVVVYENAAGTFGSPVSLEAFAGIGTLFAADLDGDGRRDLVAAAETNATQLIVFFRRTASGLQYAPATTWVARGAARAAADLDGDGDIDLLGTYAHKSLLRSGPTAGARRQSGLGMPLAPILGTPGPVVVMPGTLEHRLRRGLGGSVAFWTVGLQSSALVDFPVPGVITRNWPWLFSLVVPLGGTPMQPGAGSAELHFPVPALAGGIAFFHQAFVWDPSAIGSWRDTNLLELAIGY